MRARDLNAHAFTLGEHVAFAHGQYRPGTVAGDALLAHELAHVIQQGSGTPSASPHDQTVETDAERAAVGAALALHAPEQAPRERGPKLRSGLRLSRCHDKPQEEAVPKDAAPDKVRAKIPKYLRPEEASDTGTDKFAAQTFTVTSDDPIVYTPPGGKKTTVPKQFEVFVPSGAAKNPDVNKVELFVTPFHPTTPSGYLRQQGLRSQTDATPWIIIAVPTPGEGDSPNWTTISTADIEKCLTAAGRKNTSIDTIRLTAHSRGHRDLEHTMGFQAQGRQSPPTIDLSKVDRVSVFDASYEDLGDALTGHEKQLTRMQDPKNKSKFAPDAIRLYDVTVANVTDKSGGKVVRPKIKGVDMSGKKMVEPPDPAKHKEAVFVFSIQGVVYLRAFMDAMARGDISMADLAISGPADPQADIKPVTKALLAKMRPRGMFSTRKPTPAGMTDLPKFLVDNATDLQLIARFDNGLKDLLLDHGIDTGQPWDNDAHHFVAAELGHEAVEDPVTTP
jgi:hypothetical protein